MMKLNNVLKRSVPVFLCASLMLQSVAVLADSAEEEKALIFK